MSLTVKPSLITYQANDALSAGLIAALPFAAGSGTPVNYAPGSSIAASALAGDAAWSSGALGTDIAFPGVSGHIDLTNLTSPTNGSFEMIVALDDPTQWAVFLGQNAGFGASTNWPSDAANHLTVVKENVEFEATSTAAVALGAGTYRQLVFTYSGTTQKIYLDGVLVGTGTFTNAWNGNAAVIGSRYTTTQGFLKGRVAGFRAWSRALTQTDVTNLFSDPWRTYAPPNTTATAVTLSSPTNGLTGSASTDFTASLDGRDITGTVVVTPSDGGNGGTFTPSSISLTSSSYAATFTYTPATTGVKSISIANDRGLSNPAAASYYANVIYTVLPGDMHDNAFAANLTTHYFMSPLARLISTTTATQVKIVVWTDEFNVGGAQFASIGIRVNGADNQTLQCSGNGLNTLTANLPSGAKTVEIISGPQQINNTTEFGTHLVSVQWMDAAATIVPANTTENLTILGDSISSGFNATNPSLEAWNSVVRNTLGSVLTDASGGRSLHSIANDSTQRSTLVARLTSIPTDGYWIALGANDWLGAFQSAAAFGTSYGLLLDALHTAAPGTPIYAQTDIVSTQDGVTNGLGETLADFRAAIVTAVGTRLWATLVDGTQILTTADLNDQYHPTTAGHVKYAAYVLSQLVPPDTTAPTAPGTPVATLVATVGLLTLVAPPSTDVDNDPSTLVYNAYEDGSSDVFATSAPGDPTITATVDMDGTTHTFAFKAKDPSGNLSPIDGSVSVTYAVGGGSSPFQSALIRGTS